MAPDAAPTLKRNRQIGIDIADPMGNIGSLRFNHLHPPFNDVRARRAVAAGCLVSIDSDAHRIRELDFLRWGISQARRAWVEPRDVINTWRLDEVLAWVAAKPARLAGDPTAGLPAWRRDQ